MAQRSRFRGRARCGSALAAVVFIGGCAAPQVHSVQQAHVVILPGIGGDDLLMERMRRLIERSLPGTSAQVWDWTRIEPGLSLFNLDELRNRPRNERRARRLADQLIAWRRDHAEARLFLVGFSGGTAIAVFACDMLPGDFRIDRTILISSGLSPRYDLSATLRRSSGGVFSYYSSRDRSVLCDLTRRYGTMDGRFCESAGYCGFAWPQDAELAKRFRQLEWAPGMSDLGCDGGHIGALSTAFLCRYIVPLLQPDDARIPGEWRGPSGTSPVIGTRHIARLPLLPADRRS